MYFADWPASIWGENQQWSHLGLLHEAWVLPPCRTSQNQLLPRNSPSRQQKWFVHGEAIFCWKWNANPFQNYLRMREEHGSQEWNFIEETFLLPDDTELLREQMEKEKGSFWIIKPPNLACGEGISVVNDFEHVPVTKKPLCVQRYLMDPLLIHGLKFDLRVYVLVTSIDPLRIYLYEEGLARWRHFYFTLNWSLF